MFNKIIFNNKIIHVLCSIKIITTRITNVLKPYLCIYIHVYVLTK